MLGTCNYSVVWCFATFFLPAWLHSAPKNYPCHMVLLFLANACKWISSARTHSTCGSNEFLLQFFHHFGFSVSLRGIIIFRPGFCILHMWKNPSVHSTVFTAQIACNSKLTECPSFFLVSISFVYIYCIRIVCFLKSFDQKLEYGSLWANDEQNLDNGCMLF